MVYNVLFGFGVVVFNQMEIELSCVASHSHCGIRIDVGRTLFYCGGIETILRR